MAQEADLNIDDDLKNELYDKGGLTRPKNSKKSSKDDLLEEFKLESVTGAKHK